MGQNGTICDVTTPPLYHNLFPQLGSPQTPPAPTNFAVTVSISTALALQIYGKGNKAKTALDGVCLTMYQGEIFGLLGHNGAGKTSLHNVITGLTESTSGVVEVFGRNIRNATGFDEIHSLMGICPQHDLLYEKFTCAEHLRLFAGIKGMTGEQVVASVSRVLAETDMAEQQEQLATTMSGGQKRKLSVGIALIGDPKVTTCRMNQSWNNVPLP